MFIYFFGQCSNAIKIMDICNNLQLLLHKCAEYISIGLKLRYIFNSTADFQNILAAFCQCCCCCCNVNKNFYSFIAERIEIVSSFQLKCSSTMLVYYICAHIIIVVCQCHSEMQSQNKTINSFSLEKYMDIFKRIIFPCK